ncbi:MAG: DUF2892 domain-containing protein [Verrucomicrobia bacterium]|nr:DUF2892 domain-containing protein [Verrucomicrobiota bacterium]MBU6447188.1 DUF2892 domain-containing protein [Verrucomicrobiota bacterium]MDE3047853.1 DUF2892 domain-containing protein [Verrucomicrobiota bacterium]
MTKNIGTTDRVIRFLIAVALFVFAYLHASWILFLFGLFTLFEAVFSWCILYQILGKSSCPIDKK